MKLTLPLMSCSGLKLKEEGYVLFATDKSEKSPLLLSDAALNSDLLQTTFQGWLLWFCTHTTLLLTLLTPHLSRVQLCSEHTVLRQTPEFQRHFIELLKLLTSNAKYCQGISRIKLWSLKISVVGNQWGEREQKKPAVKWRLCKWLESAQSKKNAFTAAISCSGAVMWVHHRGKICYCFHIHAVLFQKYAHFNKTVFFALHWRLRKSTRFKHLHICLLWPSFAASGNHSDVANKNKKKQKKSIRPSKNILYYSPSATHRGSS